MIYWSIGMPGKSWRIWDDGTAGDVEEAKLDAIASLLDEDNRLDERFKNGVTVRMWECVDIDDFKVDKPTVEKFRKNNLGIEEE